MTRHVPLGHVADVIRGVSYGADDAVAEPRPEYVPIIRAGNIQADLMLDDGLVWVPGRVVSSIQKIRVDDLVMCTSSGSSDLVGKVARARSNWNGSFGAFCAVIRARPSLAHPGYLGHFLCSPRFKAWTRKSSGLNIKNIRKSELEDFPIPLPSLGEQQQIAGVLDKADGIARKRGETLLLSEQLLRSVFLDMFGDPDHNPHGWPVKLLGELCDLYAGNSLPPGIPYSGQSGGVLHLKVGDMTLPGNEEVVTSSREWSPNGLGGIIAPAGSILIPKRGGAIATNKKRVLSRPSALDPNLMAIAPKLPLSIDYVFGWFNLFDLMRIASGSTVPQLNKGDLAPLRIQVPPTKLIAAYSKRVSKIGSLVMTYRHQLVQADQLFTSLEARAFG